MDIATGCIIKLCVTDNETKIVFKLESILVFPRLKLSVHSAEIHGVLDDLKVTDPISDEKY